MSIYDVIEKESLIDVAGLFAGGYSWSETAVWWHPVSRRFFWLVDSGCSCNSFGDTVFSLSDLSNGDREGALRAFSAGASEDMYDAPSRDDVSRELARIRDFRPTEEAK